MAKIEQPCLPKDCHPLPEKVCELEAQVSVQDKLLANPVETPCPDFKRYPRREDMTDGMVLCEELWDICLPCIEGTGIDPAVAALLAMWVDRMICCIPYTLDRDDELGHLDTRRRIDALNYGTPHTTGAISKFGEECLDIVASNPQLNPDFGSVPAIYGHGSMPFIDWDRFSPVALEKMLQMLYRMRRMLREAT